jgi:hypothetical protein
MREFIKKVTADRIGGNKPGAPRAIGAAAMVGTAGAVITYKLLRK